MSFGLTLVFALLIIAAIISLFVFTCRYYSRQNYLFESSITGIFVLPDDCEGAEIILRELVMYIQRNDINCFRKIYIKTNSNNKNLIKVCRKICDEYPIFELIE